MSLAAVKFTARIRHDAALVIRLGQLVALITVLGCATPAQGIGPKRVLSRPLGAADGEIGVSKEGMRSGPQGYAVDGDRNIFVADRWNHRIQKFNSDGEFECSSGKSEHGATVPLPLEIAVDLKGSVYVYGAAPRGMIIKLDSNCQELFRIRVKELRLGDVTGLDLDHHGNLCVRGAASRRLLRLNSDSSVIGMEEKVSGFLGGVGPYRYHLAVPPDDKRTIAVERAAPPASWSDKEANERDVGEFVEWTRVRVQHDVVSCHYLGEDSRGALYVFYRKRIPGDGFLYFVRITSDGRLAGEIEVPYVSGGDLSRPYLVHWSGDLYIAGLDKTHYWIDCYPSEMFEQE